jgi:hypothetical protein
MTNDDFRNSLFVYPIAEKRWRWFHLFLFEGGPQDPYRHGSPRELMVWRRPCRLADRSLDHEFTITDRETEVFVDTLGLHIPIEATFWRLNPSTQIAAIGWMNLFIKDVVDLDALDRSCDDIDEHISRSPLKYLSLWAVACKEWETTFNHLRLRRRREVQYRWDRRRERLNRCAIEFARSSSRTRNLPLNRLSVAQIQMNVQINNQIAQENPNHDAAESSNGQAG